MSLYNIFNNLYNALLQAFGSSPGYPILIYNGSGYNLHIPSVVAFVVFIFILFLFLNLIKYMFTEVFK